MKKSKIKALIVDDEKDAQGLLSELVKKFCPELTLVGVAGDTFEAEKIIKEKAPQIVFLDIQMPQRSGIKFLQEISPFNFKVIFTTAYNEYALDAIKLSAVDYLLKPIKIEELKSAVSKCIESIDDNRNVQLLAETKRKSSETIVLPQADAIDFVEISNILYCEADGSYTIFHLEDGRSIVVSKPIGYYESAIIPFGFFRSHKSFIIQIKKVSRYERQGFVTFQNGKKSPVSRTKREELLSLLSAR